MSENRSATDPVRVDGIRDVNRALRAVSKEAAKELREGFREIAEEVAADIRGRVPHRSGRAAASVKAKGKGGGAGISFGGRAAPYYPWLDFGGTVGRGHKAGQGGGSSRRDIVEGGRYVYPAIADHRDELGQKAEDLMERLARKHDLGGGAL